MTRRLHPNATTNAATRREIQQSQESLRTLAARHGVNPKTVARWKGASSTEDARKGPKQGESTVLNLAAEALIVIYRRRMRFTIDDCLRGLKKAIPHLTRSALHRCLKRHGLGRIPAGQTEKLLQAEFHSAYYTMEIYELPARLGGKFLLFAVSDCNNSVFAKIVDGSLPHAAADFLLELTEQSPVRVNAIETNDDRAFASTEKRPWNAKHPEWIHPFRKACTLCRVDQIVVPSKSPSPKKVFKGWKGVETKRYLDLYRRSPTTHYWRLATAEARGNLDLTCEIQADRQERQDARRRAKAAARRRQEEAYLRNTGDDPVERQRNPSGQPIPK